MLQGDRFYSFDNDGAEFTIWNASEYFILTARNDELLRCETLEDAVEAAVEIQKTKGWLKEQLDETSELANWSTGFRVAR
ncbi:hypothetical protein [Tropicibacter sp. Alg240-R139]|uniref:hypothetical protein n=1 Tax=Tropicibacter sp. Alg240-R139 TaxID=2305991 RepID=UPI0013DFE11B|nr:hypothetical protein [Tropicibacter sp. Alg240-R139]